MACREQPHPFFSHQMPVWRPAASGGRPAASCFMIASVSLEHTCWSPAVNEGSGGIASVQVQPRHGFVVVRASVTHLKYGSATPTSRVATDSLHVGHLATDDRRTCRLLISRSWQAGARLAATQSRRITEGLNA